LAGDDDHASNASFNRQRPDPDIVETPIIKANATRLPTADRPLGRSHCRSVRVDRDVLQRSAN
jgi:hypothetical protein